MKQLLVLPLLCICWPLLSMIQPIAFDQKIDESYGVAVVELHHQVSYWDENYHNIHTLYVFDVIAYLKGEMRTQQLAIITNGGIVANEKQISFPDFHFHKNEEYILFFTEENFEDDYLSYRITHFDIPQVKAYSHVQGVFPNNNGTYFDLESKETFTEKQIVQRIKNRLNFDPITPNLEVWKARDVSSYSSHTHRTVTSINNGAMTNPSAYIAGTVDSDNQLIITGTGFGAMEGTVFFSNANTGGTSSSSSTVASDLVSWSDTEIRVKIPNFAGTGTVTVLDNGGGFAGSTSITIDYSITGVYSDFSGFSEVIRQFGNLADLNGSGGYTFLYNSNLPNTSTDFAGNTSAQEALERAFDNWRCESGVNFFTDGTTTTNGYANDDENVIGFSSTLDPGVLGVATLRFLAWGGGGCTYWYMEELDIQFDDDTNWNFGPGSPTGLELDFESVALHEVGHTHGLNHTIDVNQVMHYSISAGDEKRTLSSQEMAASAYVMGLSTQAPCLSGPSIPTEMISVSTKLDGSSCSLPVTLLDFSGELKNAKSHLNWTTAFERNNHFYEVEHSTNGIDYQLIGRVEGYGDADFDQHYPFVHSTPAFGNNYYRLSQEDYDGTRTNLGVIQIERKGVQEQFLLYNNPIRDGQFSGQINLDQSQNLSFVFYNTSGQQLKSNQANLEKGWNTVQFSTDELGAGLYFVSIKGEKYSEVISVFIEQ